jgi:hypothetical protein
MSTCISREGEYSDHEPGEWCPRCGAFNEEGIIAERNRLRDKIEEARIAWWSATEQGDNGLIYTDRIEDAMDDIWSAIGHADWSPDHTDGSE